MGMIISTRNKVPKRYVLQSVVESRGRGRLCSSSTAPERAAEHCPHLYPGCDGTRKTTRGHHGEYWDPRYSHAESRE